MKKFIISASLLLITMVSGVVAQSDSDEFERKEQQAKMARNEVVNSSPAAKALDTQVTIERNYDAILRAAETGDQSLIPYLKFLAATEMRTNPNSSGFQAHIALVKLGDQEAFAQVIAETNDGSPFVQDAAIKKLAQAGTKKAFQKLYELLNDTAERQPDVEIANDVIYSPNNAVVAMYELAQIIDDPPVKKCNTPKLSDIPLWKAWFGKNKHLID